MSRSRLHALVMLSAAALAGVFLTTACSDAAAPSNEEESAVASPRTEAPSGSPTTQPEIAGQLPETGQAEGPSEAGSPSFAYASATLPNIRGCFTYTTGAAYKSQPVFIYVWTGTWDFVRTNTGAARTAKTDVNGCVQFNDVPAGRYLALEAYTTFGFPTCQIWAGVSKYIGPTAKNDAVWNVGTTYVSLTQVGTPDYFSQVCLNWR